VSVGRATDVDMEPVPGMDGGRGVDRRVSGGQVGIVEHDPAAEAALHGLLLRLAGYLPDALVAEARDGLAGGYRVEVARALTFAILSGPVLLDPDEIEHLTRELLGGGDADLAGMLPDLRGERRPAPWLFVAELPARSDRSRLVVQPLDLTGIPVEDPAERAVLAELTNVQGIAGVWRSWRMPVPERERHEPVRVLVFSVDARAGGLPALSARLRAVLVGAGDRTTQVEVCPRGWSTPLYQTLARTCGALLWADRPAVPVRTAQTFDGVDAVTGPWFAPDRPVVSDPSERQRLLAALQGGAVVTRTRARMVDLRDPDRGAVVPLNLRTDGVWIWSEAGTYYLDQHNLAPDRDLVAHLLDDTSTPALDEVALHRALVHLLARPADSVVWQVDAVPAAVPVQDPSGSGAEVTAERHVSEGGMP
jgi:hypothetical protein